MKEEEKKKKKKKERTQPMEIVEKKKKGSKVAVDLDSGSLMYLITKMLLKTKLWKLKTAKMCF